LKIISRHKIGLLGGTFDPPHKGHLHISREALNILKLNRLYWSIANQNPLKKLKPKLTISQRTLLSKKIIKKNKKILILKKNQFQKINYSINEINFIKKLKKNTVLFFIIGADNLIHFHKWHKWQIITKKSNIIVFDRYGYKKKSLNSKTYKTPGKKDVIFVEFNKVNISSSQLRKI